MGLIICQKHGETGVIPFISKGLWQIAKQNTKIDCDKIKVITIAIKIDQETSFSLKYYFTKDEFDLFSLDDYYSISTDEEDEKVTKIFHDKTRPMCGDCFKEYLESIRCGIAL